MDRKCMEMREITWITADQIIESYDVIVFSYWSRYKMQMMMFPIDWLYTSTWESRGRKFQGGEYLYVEECLHQRANFPSIHHQTRFAPSVEAAGRETYWERLTEEFLCVKFWVLDLIEHYFSLSFLGKYFLRRWDRFATLELCGVSFQS